MELIGRNIEIVNTKNRSAQSCSAPVMKSASETCTVSMLTPPGMGGISVLELQGTGVLQYIAPFLHPSPRHKVGHLHVCRVQLREETIDEIILAQHPPRNRREIIRLNCHGGEAVRKQLFQWLYSLGFVDANPVNKAPSHAEAASLQLPLATTRAGALSLLAQSKGLNEQFLDQFQKQLTNGISESLMLRWNQYIKRSKALLYLLHPASVILTGRPNAGKSSLFNRLLEKDRSLVSQEPGTTIDTIQVHCSMEGVPIWLSDMAGRRHGGGLVENRGIELGKRFVQSADHILYLIDSQQGMTREDEKFLQEYFAKRITVIYSRSDLVSADRIPAKACRVSIHNPVQIQLMQQQIANIVTHGCSLPITEAALCLPAALEKAKMLAALLESADSNWKPALESLLKP